MDSGTDTTKLTGADVVVDVKTFVYGAVFIAKGKKKKIKTQNQTDKYRTMESLKITIKIITTGHFLSLELTGEIFTFRWMSYNIWCIITCCM